MWRCRPFFCCLSERLVMWDGYPYCVSKNRAKMLSQKKSVGVPPPPPPPSPAHQLIWDLRDFRRWWRSEKVSESPPPPPPLSASDWRPCFLTTSPGFLPALCKKWSGFFCVHRVLLSYTRDRRLKVSSERRGNEDKAPCPRTLKKYCRAGVRTGELRYESQSS